MKTNILIALAVICSLTTNAQSILSTTESKSGILAGIDTNHFKYIGIGYESASDKFSLNYRFTRQNNKLKPGRHYPDFYGLNCEVAANVENNKDTWVEEKKWTGNLNFEVTFFKTWDKTTLTSSSPSGTPGVNNTVNNIKQNTFYLKLSDGFKRIKTFETTVLNSDTTFITLYNPLQNKLTFSTGFNWFRNCGSDWYFSFAVSTDISYINKSTRSLTTSNLATYSGSFINSADSSGISQFGEQESYYHGKVHDEIYLVPRIDFFARRQLHGNNPILGLLVSYSPLISSIREVKVRNCFAIGPTLGLNRFPSQVVFGLMNEFIQNSKGTFKYALTFNVSLPIIFK